MTEPEKEVAKVKAPQRAVLRRNKKYKKSKDLRQSVHEITAGLEEIDFEQEPAAYHPPSSGGLKRSKSFQKDLHQRKPVQNDREILKEYAVSLLQTDELDDLRNNNNNNNEETVSASLVDETGCNFSLHEAIERSELKEISIHLVRNHDSIDLEEKNVAGQTPLAFAVALELIDVVKLLIAAGANVNPTDNYGVTALRYAVEVGDFDTASLLISHGANAQSVQNGF